MENPSGLTRDYYPYLRAFLPDGVLLPSQSTEQKFVFRQQGNALPLSYTLTVLSGQGNR